MFKPSGQDTNKILAVFVSTSCFSVVWNDFFGLSCNELWENGIRTPTPFDGLVALSDAAELWKLNESTLRKAISCGKLKVGFDVCNYGKQWVVTKEAMVREYGPLSSISDTSSLDSDLMTAEKRPGCGTPD